MPGRAETRAPRRLTLLALLALVGALPCAGGPLAMEEARRLALDGDRAAAARLALWVATSNPGKPISVDAFALFLRTERRVDALLAGSRAVAGTLASLPGTQWLMAEVAQLFELAGFDEEAASWAEQSWRAGGPPEMLLRSLRLRLAMGEGASVLASIAEVRERAAGIDLRPTIAAAELAAGRLEEARASFEDILGLGTDPCDRLAAAWGLFSLARAAGDEAAQARAAARLRTLFPDAPEAMIVEAQAAGSPRVVEAPSPSLLLAAGTVAQPEPAAPQPAATFAIQVGSFRVQENADELAAELKRKGYEAVARKASTEDSALWRVYVGSRLSASRGAELLDRLGAEGYPGLMVPSP